MGVAVGHGDSREANFVEDIKRRVAHVSGEDTPLFVGGAA